MSLIQGIGAHGDTIASGFSISNMAWLCQRLHSDGVHEADCAALRFLHHNYMKVSWHIIFEPI